MIEFKMDETQMFFENERYATQMIINGKGDGHDKGEPRLRCAVAITVRVKEMQNGLKLRANIYWDTKSPKTQLIFTGGSLVNFIEEQGHNYDEFKKY